MNRSRIILIVLLALGTAALAVLTQGEYPVEITPRPLLYLVADAERHTERIPLAMTRVSVEEENRIGREMVRHANQRSHPLSGSQRRIEQYLNAIGGQLGNQATRKGIHYAIHYEPDSSFENAFALPGGQIVIGKGLLDLFETEDELAAVLGHEIAHVDQRHCIERLQYELKMRKVGLDGIYGLGSIGIQIFQRGYSKNQELEADRTGLRLAVAAGFSPGGAISAMRRLAVRSSAPPPPRSPVEEAGRIAAGTLPEYFRSHPPPAERITAFDREIEQQGWNRHQPQHPLPDFEKR